MLHFIFVEHQSISYRITSSPVSLIQYKAFVLRTERTPTRWFLSSKDPPEFIYIEPLILTVKIMPLNTSLILVDYFFSITEESIVKLWRKTIHLFCTSSSVTYRNNLYRHLFILFVFYSIPSINLSMLRLKWFGSIYKLTRASALQSEYHNSMVTGITIMNFR